MYAHVHVGSPIRIHVNRDTEGIIIPGCEDAVCQNIVLNVNDKTARYVSLDWC